MFFHLIVFRCYFSWHGLCENASDISADQARVQEMIERSGRRTVPQIFIDDEPISGFDELSKMNLRDRQD